MPKINAGLKQQIEACLTAGESFIKVEVSLGNVSTIMLAKNLVSYLREPAGFRTHSRFPAGLDCKGWYHVKRLSLESHPETGVELTSTIVIPMDDPELKVFYKDFYFIPEMRDGYVKHFQVKDARLLNNNT